MVIFTFNVVLKQYPPGYQKKKKKKKKKQEDTQSHTEASNYEEQLDHGSYI